MRFAVVCANFTGVKRAGIGRFGDLRILSGKKITQYQYYSDFIYVFMGIPKNLSKRSNQYAGHEKNC